MIDCIKALRQYAAEILSTEEELGKRINSSETTLIFSENTTILGLYLHFSTNDCKQAF